MGAIQVLPPGEARKIAAGEVIDRPAALIREFLDNAIDADAAAIDVSVDGGGCKKAEVSDDGRGMGRDDLEICWLTHATSKIRSLDDLGVAETLGFRGEALAAAAAVARLEIISGVGDGEAWRLEVGPGESNPPRLEPTGRTKGSTVRAVGLFDSIPARKRFLKRESSEGALCRQVFVEKALAFPEIAFRFTQDGRPKDFLPCAASKKERFAAALLETRQRGFLHEMRVSGEGFSVDIVIGGPELFRQDRRMLYVFANGRRIQDYSLMLAMENGAQGWFPNGTHPMGAVHIDVDPALADFNVHPAKREARFRDPGAMYRAISEGLRDFRRRHGPRPGAAAAAGQTEGLTGDALAREALADASWLGAARGRGPESAGAGSGFPFCGAPPVQDRGARFDPARVADAFAGAGQVAEKAPVYGEARYAGRAFGLFILAEWGDRLYVIDQHAAHERILYDRFLKESVPAQELLVPLFFVAESAEDDGFIEAKREQFARMALVIEKDGDGWRIDALPAGWSLGDSETVKKILDLRNSTGDMAERWAALCCCHQATRDGDFLDDATAERLARDALALPDPRCPHGRPVWTEISREALCRAVRRV